QRVNFERAAETTKFIRDREPEGVTVSVGAEIGEVGGKNSDVHELRAFMDGYLRTLKRLGPHVGISKISVQTGTSHGGVVLPDGSIAKVQIDLDALKALSRDAREQYGLGGAVQHGASTLPPEAFGADLEKTFAFLFEQLRVAGTRAAVDRIVKPPLQSHAAPRPVAAHAPDDLEAGE